MITQFRKYERIERPKVRRRQTKNGGVNDSLEEDGGSWEYSPSFEDY